MPDSIINIVNTWDKKTKREIYDEVIDFKDGHKNPYHWYYEDDVDGMLENPKLRETYPIPAKSPAVYFDADKAYGTATDLEV